MPKQHVSSAALGLAVIACTGIALAHVDDPKVKELSQFLPAGGTYSVDGIAGVYDALNVTLMSHIPPGDFGTDAQYASDCWGYTSPSGREYAIVGLRNATAWVEITNPGEPEIVYTHDWAECLWYDMKVFQHYAYVVNDCLMGMQIYDMSAIDDGVVSYVTTDAYPSDSHNVVIDTTSGYLYRTGGGAGGLVVYDLNADPSAPAVVAYWPDRYVHDAWAHTYTSGPYAGREIVICCGGFNGGSVETGLDILDVTDKKNIVLLDRYALPGGEYSHQGCLSADGTLFYMGDEGDEGGGVTTNSLIIDLNDLENVELVQSYTSGLLAVDHNQYVRNNLVFQANYTTGLRVFDASDPLAPTEVGYFDTYPANNSAGFSGLWSNFPYFPSGTVIGSGSGGLWVWQVNVDEDVPCPADANGDEVVDVEDMVAVILDWGCIGGSCLGDVNADGTVDVADLIEVVLAWGDCQ